MATMTVRIDGTDVKGDVERLTQYVGIRREGGIDGLRRVGAAKCDSPVLDRFIEEELSRLLSMLIENGNEPEGGWILPVAVVRLKADDAGEDNRQGAETDIRGYLSAMVAGRWLALTYGTEPSGMEIQGEASLGSLMRRLALRSPADSRYGRARLRVEPL